MLISGLPPEIAYALRHPCDTCGNRATAVAVDFREIVPLDGTRRFQQTKVTPYCKLHKRNGEVVLLSGAVLKGRRGLDGRRTVVLPS